MEGHMNQNNFSEIHMVIDVLRRRKRLLVVTIFCCLLLSLLPVMLLPSMYQSTAVILIESQEIPQELVRSTVTGYVEERLKAITQISLSRANLLSIIERHGLYQEEKNRMTTEEIVEKMRKDISMAPIQADVIGASGRPVAATIAFSLSYKNKNPRMALNTTNTLVSLFLEENYKSREAKASTTYGFLEKQLAELSQQMNTIEAEIAKFKDTHLTALPEMVAINLQNLERIQRELDTKREYIRSLTDRKVYLEGQLATLSPTRPYAGTDGRAVLQPAEELRVLRNQYISLSATRSEKHPDIISLKQKIAALEAYVGDNSSALEDLKKRKMEQEVKITNLLAKYTSNHPEVQAAQKELAAIEALIAEASTAKKTRSSQPTPDNPAYITVDTQLKSTMLEIEAEKNNMSDLQRKYDDYQKRVEESPQVEQTYRKLQRDLNVTQLQYQENMAKLMTAREAKVLEEERVGERLTLIDPPIMPESPISPNRLLLLAVGFVVSFCIGGGTVALREMLDSSLHGLYQVSAITPLPVLVSIPYYATNMEKRKRRTQRNIIIAAGIVLIIGMTLLFHFAFMPLDVLFYTLLTKIQARF